MGLFSFSKKSYERRLSKRLQDKFYRISKRNRLLARWAARKMGFSRKDLFKYSEKIVKAYVLVPNDRRLIAIIRGDLDKAGIQIEDKEIFEYMLRIEKRVMHCKIQTVKDKNIFQVHH